VGRRGGVLARELRGIPFNTGEGPSPRPSTRVPRPVRIGGALRINAYPGTGKTSTFVMVAHSTNKTGAYMSFKKSIGHEARRNFSLTVGCATVHSMAYRAIALDGGPSSGGDSGDRATRAAGTPGVSSRAACRLTSGSVPLCSVVANRQLWPSPTCFCPRYC
jgi:hypothetical protein